MKEKVKNTGFIDRCDFNVNDRGLYFTDGNIEEHVVSYYSKEDIQNEKYNFYGAILKGIQLDEDIDSPNFGKSTVGNLIIKLGADSSGFINRYKNEQLSKDFNEHVILLRKINSTNKHLDKAIFQQLDEILKSYDFAEHISSKDTDGKTEQYKIKDVFKLEMFLSFVDEAISYAYPNQHREKEYMHIYTDLMKLFQEFVLTYKLKFNICNLCTRAGKTAFSLLCGEYYNKHYNTKIDLMLSYVGTAYTSYKTTIEKYKDWENILFIDPDTITDENFDMVVEKIKSHCTKARENRVMIYLALTGNDKCWTRRTRILKSLNEFKYNIFVEEADYGSACANQVKKIRTLDENAIKVCLLTGTGVDKLKSIVGENEYGTLVYDYITDILPMHKKKIK